MHVLVNFKALEIKFIKTCLIRSLSVLKISDLITGEIAKFNDIILLLASFSNNSFVSATSSLN